MAAAARARPRQHRHHVADPVSPAVDWLLFVQAFGLLLVIEGLWPFLSPAKWRETLARMSEARDHHVRMFALVSMVCGLLLLWCSH